MSQSEASPTKGTSPPNPALHRIATTANKETLVAIAAKYGARFKLD